MIERRASSRCGFGCRVTTLFLGTLLSQACESTVVTPVEIDQVVVVPPEITLMEGEQHAFSAVLREESGQELTGGSVTWTVADSRVATVTSGGAVEARAPGTTVLRASVGGVSGTAAIAVLRGPTLELSRRSVTFEVSSGDSQPRSIDVDVENAGAGTVDGLGVAVESQGGATTSWLAAELLASAAPTRLRLHADPTGLAPGAYAASVTVASSSTGEAARVDISLLVRDPGDDDDDDDEDDDSPGGGAACEIRDDFILGDLHVPRSTRCVLLNVVITGHLRLEAGASVTGSDLRVSRNVEAKEAAELTLTDVLVFGDLRFEDGGSVTLRESYVGGKVELKENLGAIDLTDNEVGDEVKLEGNRGGPFLLVRNTIDEKLDCKQNDPTPSGSGNVADQKTGQCSGL